MSMSETPQILDKIWRNEDGTFKKGHPRLGGRPPGKSLKTFAREFLENLPDEEKTEYLASLPPEIVWRMAEGNPSSENKLDLTPDTINAIKYIVPNGDNPTTNS